MDKIWLYGGFHKWGYPKMDGLQCPYILCFSMASTNGIPTGGVTGFPGAVAVRPSGPAKVAGKAQDVTDGLDANT